MLGQLADLRMARGGAEDLARGGIGSAFEAWLVLGRLFLLRLKRMGQRDKKTRSGIGEATHTGKTSGMPPRTALVPSSLAASLSHSFSAPFLSFQLTTVAPYSSTSTLSPVGSTAVTRELSSEKVTCGWGARPGVLASAVGLLARSTMASSCVVDLVLFWWGEGLVVDVNST